MPRERGVVNTWNGEKQFGFVSVTNGKADAFLHSENVRDRDLRDEVKKKGFKRGDKIRFDLEPPETGRGKMVAVNIELEGWKGGRSVSRSRSPRRSPSPRRSRSRRRSPSHRRSPTPRRSRRSPTPRRPVRSRNKNSRSASRGGSDSRSPRRRR
mmetsp:Transcript_31975/g.62918  ORF Transcript_31975/g.62918 Transcript_31975/m.62918 type:complete len:154 (-) Transcript_31975:105-566(-)